MPPSREVEACVRSTSATKEWLLCGLSTNATVGQAVAAPAGGGVGCWRTARESGSLLLFGANTPCHAAVG